MPQRSMCAFATGSLLFLTMATCMMAQSPLSKIVGTVTDPAGGAVPGAKATARNDGTGYRGTATTDERGYYEVDKLPDGTYTVEIEMTGFRPHKQGRIVLETRQTMRIDVTLTLGDVTQSVEVIGQAPVVTTDTGQIHSGHFNRKAITNNYLPQISNVYIATAGALSPSFQAFQGVGTTAAQNKTTVDGVEMNNFFLNVETLQEVKVMTSGNSAEYASPMVMDFATQSGTNSLHGKFLMQLANPALNSLGPNTNRRGPGYPTTRDQLWSVSGPVRIPKIYDGKDRTFFYIDRYWLNTVTYAQGAAPTTIPPEALRAGDFSFLPAGRFRTGVLVDPLSGTPFPGNRIPATGISAVSSNIQKLYPATNFPSQNPTNDGLNYVRDPGVPTGVSSGSNLSVKFDHQLTQKDRIGWASTWRRALSTSDRSNFNFWWLSNNWPSNSQRVYWTRVIRPHIMNEFRAGIERKDEKEGTDPNTPIPTGFSEQYKGNGIAFMKALGFTWLPTLDPTTSASLPVINIGGGFASGFDFGFTGGYDYRVDTRNITDNLTWVHGAHSLKMGGDLRPAYNQTIKWGQATAGRFDFTGRFSGHPYGDYLLGLPDNSARSGVTPRPYRQQIWGGVFIQDNWRVTPRLNLELGLRYEHNGLAFEKRYMMSNFDPVTGSIVVPDEKSRALVSPAFPSTIPIKTSAEVGFPLLLRNRPQFHWFPRVGFAYRPTRIAKTVVRGSFGFFSVPPSWEAGGGACCAPDGSAMATRVPFALDEAFSNNVTNGRPAFSFPYPFPQAFGAVAGQTALGVNKNFPFGYTANWNFTIEREVLPDTALRLTYLGVKGTNLPYQNYISPTFGRVPVYSGFSRVTLVNAGGNMSYQGMEASLKRRFSAGVQFEAFYSWGHKLGLPSVLRPWRETDFGDYIEDAGNRERDRGRAPDWADQRFSLSHVIEMPFGRGRKWFSTAPRAADYIFGGWNLSGWWWFDTWKPINPVVTGQDPLGLGRNIRASVVPGCNPNIAPTLSAVFDTKCFTRPAAGQYGDAAWNGILPASWVGLGQNNVAVYKDFRLPVRESAMLRIGGKFVNLFNHPWLTSAGGSNTIGGGTAGRGAMTGNRTIRVEAKIEF
ncbi:MAG: TonB-dependent receptor domain-containing protein [Bryobacteraceae bacterium]